LVPFMLLIFAAGDCNVTQDTTQVVDHVAVAASDALGLPMIRLKPSVRALEAERRRRVDRHHFDPIRQAGLRAASQPRTAAELVLDFALLSTAQRGKVRRRPSPGAAASSFSVLEC
jgi:hypothetical protein